MKLNHITRLHSIAFHPPREAGSSCPTTCCMSSFELPQKLGTGKQSAVEEGIDADIPVISFENESNSFSNWCRFHLHMKFM